MNSDKQQAKVDAEELARTQVLNLEELRQVAKYEKKVSDNSVVEIIIIIPLLLIDFL